MRISDWSSDVCSSDLFTLSESSRDQGIKCGGCGESIYGRWAKKNPARPDSRQTARADRTGQMPSETQASSSAPGIHCGPARSADTSADNSRSEEHTSELQSLMRNSYAVFCFQKK